MAKKPGDVELKAPTAAPSKSKHGKKPQRDQQNANQALQLFSHLQQYRVRCTSSDDLQPHLCSAEIR